MKYSNAVFDFETMGTGPDAVVISLAFTPFNYGEPEKFEDVINRTHSWKFNWQEQIANSRSVDESTLKWWDQQDPEVKKEQFKIDSNSVSLSQMIDDIIRLKDKYGFGKQTVVYCRGQSFDFPIMTDIVKKDGRFNHSSFLCQFWNQRDIRSMLDGLMVTPGNCRVPIPMGKLKGFKKHNPIHDNAKAVLQLQYAWNYATGIKDVPECNDEIDPNSY